MLFKNKNRRFFSFLVCCGLCSLISCTADQDKDLQLWYNAPASVWEETLPLGNGRLGLMPDGNPSREVIVLNDITLWSGSPEDATNPTAQAYLPRIRQLLLEGRNDLAQELMYEHFVCGGPGSGYGTGSKVPFGCYQTLGSLIIEYREPVTPDSSHYHRSLDLTSAVASTCTQTTKNEYFCSFSDDVGVIRLESEQGINAVIRMERPERFETTAGDDQLIMKGTLSSGVQGKDGMSYIARLSAIPEDGTVLYRGDSLVLDNVHKATLLFSAATDYYAPDYQALSDSLMQTARQKSYRDLRSGHIKAYRERFNRVTLSLGQNSSPAKASDIQARANDRQARAGNNGASSPLDKQNTLKRLEAFSQSDDPSFAALYFHYGRYLLISSVRPDLLPPNLQGLWANSIQTPWNGDYHLNINLQMNHWPVEVCNLSELHKPLVEFTKGLVASGTVTARSFYNADGWTAHVISNPWHFTAPGEHPSWGATNTGGGWLCQHLWTHYLYTKDTTYLAEVYPVMKGACEFFLSSLIEEPTHRWLVTAPTTSPENAFYMPGTGTAVSVCMGSTMDNQIVRELFTNTSQAAVLLDTDAGFRNRLDSTVKRLPPDRIASGGYLQEWLEDYRETEPHHRHVSHLFGLHPGRQISPARTPELAEACRNTLERRGDGGTGWSRAWKINFRARLGDGNRAYRLLKNLLSPESTYPNLFCAHPPFQIDGNFGGTSGIAEMLLQSHDGSIEFLPALPDAWPEGEFSGLKTEGNGEVSCQWENGRIREITLRAISPGTFKIKIPPYSGKIRSEGNVSLSDGMATATLEPGEKIRLRFLTAK